MLHQEKELSNDLGRPLSYNDFTDKMQSPGFTNDYKFCISVNEYQ